MKSHTAAGIFEFDVVATAGTAGVHALRLSAMDAPSAVRTVESQGMRVLSCTQHRRGFRNDAAASGENSLHANRARLDVALFAHEFGTLLDAGLGIIDAVETLAEKERVAATQRIFGKIILALKEGRSLSSVLQEMPRIFPDLLVASVAASEQTGHMAAALLRYATNFESLRAIRSKAVGAMVYPLMLLAVGVIVVLFLLGFVVPRFSTLIESTRGEIPLASQVLIAVGKTIHENPQLTLGMTLALAGLTVWGIRRGSRAGWNLPMLQRLPVIGRLMRTFRIAQFYRTAGMLVEAGIPAVRAFDMCGSLLTPGDATGLRAAVTSMHNGGAIGPALQAAGLADPVALRMLTVAQRTGRLTEILARIAGFQEASLLRAIDVATRLFEPILMMVIGFVVGGVVVLMYLPIFDLASSIQ